MTILELDELAHEIAEEGSKSIIDCHTLAAEDSKGYRWHDLATVDGEEETFWVERAATYLEAAGILIRSAENAQWVGWDEDELL